ncbi:MAG: hypothetical protein F6J95_020715 [Leptolyngbya sp. SIO1E4]|nr:hypothetical protein [Leptolyngbya sp. SIO1E4]
MRQSGKVDFNFRYRPKADSPDGILMQYLNSFDPMERRALILRALRAFYATAAYADQGEALTLDELEAMARYLKETAGTYDQHQFTLEVETSVVFAEGESRFDSPLED